MEPECVEYVEPLSQNWAKLGEFLLRNKGRNLPFLQFSQIKALTPETHVHMYVPVSLFGFKPNHTGAKLIFYKDYNIFLILFLCENTWKAFFVSVNNKLK